MDLCVQCLVTSHLFSSALHHLHGDGIDLVVHFHCPPLSTADLHQQYPEVGATQIQRQEVPILYMTPSETELGGVAIGEECCQSLWDMLY